MCTAASRKPITRYRKLCRESGWLPAIVLLSSYTNKPQCMLGKLTGLACSLQKIGKASAVVLFTVYLAAAHFGTKAFVPVQCIPIT